MSTSERRRIANLATLIAALSAPASYLWLTHHGSSVAWAAIFAVLLVALFRGAVDHGLKRLVPPPELFGVSDERERAEDALRRKRLYWWGRKFRLAGIFAVLVTIAWADRGGTWGGNATWIWHTLGHAASNKAYLQQLIILPIFFLFNFLIFMGPMAAMGISQIHGFEPGDASWGVKLEDVRGQAEAKEEIRKVITLWQSGERFEKAGGKRERGILFLGAPGTGKTMLAKAIATGFNCPIVTIPGSGFAQTFVGMDIIIVRFMARKARKLAAKWGGQCIVFIDEIDAVGMRRSSLGGGGRSQNQMPGGMMGGMMGGGAINQLLVVMDGIDSPPFLRRTLTTKINLWLDVLYVVPQRIGRIPLRLPKAKPTGNQIYFVGATNVPLTALDPALVRPGRMGRHIHFRQPTKRDRVDIFDLYLGKVSHDPEMDTDEAREELARITAGYSPAEIEQVCSIALTYAQHETRTAFNRRDLLEAMVTVEAGTALGWGYESTEEELATAIHEAGHAVAAHLFKPKSESTRLSIRRRGETGGHHQTVETVERTFHNRAELIADLVWGLGAYAAELAFYGHNTQGVGGDLGQASHLAGTMVGRWGMAPLKIESNDVQGVRRKLETIGKRLLAVAGPTDIKLPSDKYRDEAIIVGYAFTLAWNTIQHNKAAVQKVATSLVRDKEIFGDDVVKLLDGVGLEAPTIDWDEAVTFPEALL